MALLWAVVGLAVAVGIVFAAVKLTKSNAGGGTPTTTPTTGTGGGAQGGALYKLAAAAKAGGFRVTHKVPSFEKNDAKAVANDLKTQIGQAGVGTFKGKPVTAAYSVGSKHQPVTAVFSGYNGTFNSATIITGFMHTVGGHKVAAGPHGGSMACGKKSGGTVCMWATPKTLGVVEFFNNSGPTVFKNAAADALKIRSGVETPAK